MRKITIVINLFLLPVSEIDPQNGEENPDIPPFTVERILIRNRDAPNSLNLNWRSILKDMAIIFLEVEESNNGVLFELNIFHHPVS
jgi:hypothetical protein